MIYHLNFCKLFNEHWVRVSINDQQLEKRLENTGEIHGLGKEEKKKKNKDG